MRFPINKCDGVKAAVVMLRGRNPEEHHLAAYLQPQELKLETVIKQCKEYLPQYMVPSRIMFMNSFPLNERQKVDRSKFQEIPIKKQEMSTEKRNFKSQPSDR